MGHIVAFSCLTVDGKLMKLYEIEFLLENKKVNY